MQHYPKIAIADRKNRANVVARHTIHFAHRKEGLWRNSGIREIPIVMRRLHARALSIHANLSIPTGETLQLDFSFKRLPT
jgi:hypothetical protein